MTFGEKVKTLRKTKDMSCLLYTSSPEYGVLPVYIPKWGMRSAFEEDVKISLKMLEPMIFLNLANWSDTSAFIG